MPIISISVNEKILQEMDKLQEELGYTGRSEIIRAGIRNLIAENKQKEKLEGKIKAILLLVHNEKAESTVTEIKHRFEHVINTHIHSRLKEQKCLEVLIVDGDAKIIKELMKNAEINKKIEYTKLIIP